MAFTTQVRHKCGYFNIFSGLDLNMFFKLCLFCVLGLNIVSCTYYCKDHFENCICTDEYVRCHNEVKLNGGTNITKLFHSIQDDVTEITITGSRLVEIPKNTFGSCRHDSTLVLHKLKMVDLSSNNISRIHGKSFHCMPHLEYLNLSDNAWEVDRSPDMTGYFSSMPMIKHLNLSNTFDEVWDGNIHLTKLARVFNETDMYALETLDLSYNEFYTFPLTSANSLCQMTSLKTLNLSHNNLEDPSLPSKLDCFETLEILDLSHNTMPVLSQEFMDKVENLHKLKYVKLDNNPFYCDCGLISTWMWLNVTKVPVNKNELKCAGGYNSPFNSRPVLSLSLSDLRECKMMEPPFNSAVKAAFGIVYTIIGFALIDFMTVL